MISLRYAFRAIALFVFLLLSPCVGSAADLFFLQGDNGDYIAGNSVYFYTGATASFVPNSSQGGGGRNIDVGPSTTSWYLAFEAPGRTRVVPGVYEDAARFPFQAFTQPGLNVSGDGRGCNTLTGRFVVIEAEYASSDKWAPFTRLAVDFEQHCEGGAPIARGAVRFNSAVPCKPGDNDCDGLADADEATSGTDPWNPDSDQDGLTDGEEVQVHFTDPLDKDDDDDGLTDLQEVRIYHTSPSAADTDGDGLTDSQEVLTTRTNPLEADEDGDGMTDPVEIRYRTDPRRADTDGDGLTDPEEVFETGTDPSSRDTDGDTLSDFREVRETGTDPLSGDPDEDYILDPDELRFGTDPFLADTDGDGLSDYEELLVHGTQALSPTTVLVFHGTASVRSAATPSSFAVNENLFLEKDRTYLLESELEGIPQRGVWFVTPNQIALFPQNLLESIQALESELAVELGEPAVASVTSFSRAGAVDPRTGLLVVRGSTTYGLFLPQHGVSARVTIVFTVSAQPVPLPATTSASSPSSSARGADLSPGTNGWVLSGTSNGRLGRQSVRGPIGGTLSLDGDRSFVLAIDGAPVQRGVWFEDKSKLYLYPQNLLEQLPALDAVFSGQAGRPVDFTLLTQQITGVRNSRSRTVTLSMRSSGALIAPDYLLPVSSSSKITGAPLP